MIRRLPAVLVAGVLLAGCGTGADPAAERRADVAALTAAANDGDAEGVRRGAEALLATVAAQLEAEEVTADEAERLTALAESVRARADLIDTDLIERQRAEAEAEQAREELAEAERRLEEERGARGGGGPSGRGAGPRGRRGQGQEGRREDEDEDEKD